MNSRIESRLDGGRRPVLRVAGALDAEGSPAAPRRPDGGKLRPRAVRSRLAQPLITALAALTLVAAGSSVMVAASTAGSVWPGDWSRLDWAAVASHYQLCVQESQGLDVAGCMVRPTAHSTPAAADSQAAAGSSKSVPFSAVTVIYDQPSPTARPAVKASASPASPGTTHPAKPAPAAAAAAAPPATPRPVPSTGDD